MANRKRKTYQTPRIYVPFTFEYDDECNIIKQDAQLPQRDSATRYVRKFVLRFMRYDRMEVRKVSNNKSDFQGHSRALAMVALALVLLFINQHTKFEVPSF